MDLFQNAGHIAGWILFAGLFFPRVTLFFAWAGTGVYPANQIPDLLNLILWLFIPRFLIAYYIYTDMGPHNFWFCAYLITGLLGLLGDTKIVKNGRVIFQKNIVCRINLFPHRPPNTPFEEK